MESSAVMSLTITEANLADANDGQAILNLLSTYAADPMGAIWLCPTKCLPT